MQHFMHNFSNYIFDGALQTCVDLLDLVKSYSNPSFNECLLAKFIVDTAENEPTKVSNSIPTQAIQFHSCILPSRSRPVTRCVPPLRPWGATSSSTSRCCCFPSPSSCSLRSIQAHRTASCFLRVAAHRCKSMIRTNSRASTLVFLQRTA